MSLVFPFPEKKITNKMTLNNETQCCLCIENVPMEIKNIYLHKFSKIHKIYCKVFCFSLNLISFYSSCTLKLNQNNMIT